MKQAPSSPIPKSTEASSNLLVKIPSPEPSKENSGIMWSPSPECPTGSKKTLPHGAAAFQQHSNCPGSPAKLSEAAAQETVVEMQAQIVELKHALASPGMLLAWQARIPVPRSLGISFSLVWLVTLISCRKDDKQCRPIAFGLVFLPPATARGGPTGHCQSL